MYQKRVIPTIFLTSLLIFAVSQFSLANNVSLHYANDDNLYNTDYFDLIDNAYDLTSSEKQLLKNNKFVVLNRMGTEDILDAFKFYWEEDLPIFITTDTMLHTWHLIFDQTLLNLEERIFYPILSELSEALVLNALTEYLNDNLMGETLIYLLVASELANSPVNDELPPDIKNASDKIVDAIFNEISLTSAISRLNTDLTRRFIDDFSQYKPRGHYTHSLILENYFRLFKWFSRIPFFFDHYAGVKFLKTSPEMMIYSTIELTWLLKETIITWFNNSITGLEIWDIFKSFLDVIVGPTNSISPRIINNICSDSLGDFWSIDDIDNTLISYLQETVLNDTSIPRPKIQFIIDSRAGSNYSPKTFVLFGERLTLDSYALNNFVYPSVFRLLPTSLDFSAACLGSQRSLELLEAEFERYPGLMDRILEMREELNNITGMEKQTVHWKWVESLSDIAVPKPEYNGSIILPEFMDSNAWLDEKLTTIMGSWAQLKHDLILYSKQSSTMFICSTPTGYVEPYPEFYKSLRNLSQLYKNSLLPLQNIGYNFSTYDYYYLWALDDFSNATQMLEIISKKELTGIPLNHQEKRFINGTYSEYYSGMCGDPGRVRGWLSEIIGKLKSAYRQPDSIPNSRCSLVADIHTDTNTGSILHLATGLLEPIIAFVPGWEGEDIAVVGPVFSFYEFALPGYQRLNDDEWRGVLALWLDSDNRENYDFSIFKRGFWAEDYMVSTFITKTRIFSDEEQFEPPNWFVESVLPTLKVLRRQYVIPIIIISTLCIGGIISAIKRKRLMKKWDSYRHS
ncbi:MAG: DUF3160 domain-containing protein [Promethearchaeota archaeon]|jgi:hypothetical protein